jgi:probable rRNA maturation factor
MTRTAEPKIRSKHTEPHKLVLTLQYAVDKTNLPKRNQIKKWALAALFHDAELTIRFVDEEEGKQLNSDFRNKSYATNVLSFVYDDVINDKSTITGDIVLCTSVIAQEALQQNKKLEAHYAHLIVHGVLHLQEYDHQQETEAEQMERLETEIMLNLGYADPYTGA